MSEPRLPPGILLFGGSVILSLVIVVGGSVFSSDMQTHTLSTSYGSVHKSVREQIEADDDAHAALTAAQTSDFTASATALVAALSPCIGAPATTSATAALSQLAHFQAIKPPPRDIPTPSHAPGSQEDYLAAAQRLLADLTIDKARTAQTNADLQSILISQDEVNQRLDAIAAGIAGSPRALVSKDSYATGAVKDAYKKSVAGVAAVVTKIAPSLKAQRAVKISPAQSTALLSALTGFVAQCKSEAASNAAKTPSTVTTRFLGWGMKSWPTVTFPYAMTLTVNTPGTPTPGCTSVKLLAQGIATGHLLGHVTVTAPRTVPPVFKILTHYTSATSVQYAVVECSAS